MSKPKIFNVKDAIRNLKQLAMNHELMLEDIESQRKELQEDSKNTILKILSQIQSEEELQFVVTGLYWQGEPVFISATVLQDYLGVTNIGLMDYVSPMYIDGTCYRCNTAIKIKVKSRTELRIKGVDRGQCDQCIEKTTNGTVNHSGWSREREIAALRAMPYREYLQSEWWSFIRSRRLRQAGFRCQICNEGGCVLDVHHRTYERVGAERLSDLTVLCRECHTLFHQSDAGDNKAQG